jgi:hypothetical protein
MSEVKDIQIAYQNFFDKGTKFKGSKPVFRGLIYVIVSLKTPPNKG